MLSTFRRSAAALGLAVLLAAAAPAVAAGEPPPPEVTVASSTTLLPGATSAPFTLTVTNTGPSAAGVELPLPGAVTDVAVDTGELDDGTWRLRLGPAGTATLRGILLQGGRR